ncbi:MAG: tRNA pseudouridine(38-40) synthase TruA [bacterium]|nr:tRNA pseudouridine(38-40) synthase TruA [bacterium]
MATYKLTISYDGSRFKGWQRHPGQPTIQGALEDALMENTGIRAPIEGSGRTDSGAHADAQIASVTVPDGTELGDFNAVLVPGVQVLDIEPSHEGFHARKESTGKTYRYVIWNSFECPEELVGKVWHVPGHLDVEAMLEACPHFVGQIDFASFAKKPNFKRASTFRQMTRVDLEFEPPQITITMQANSFLYKMVRNVVRTLVRVGEGRMAPDDIPSIIALGDRSAAPGTAPASGLHLEKVHY